MKKISSKNYLAGLRVHLVPALVWIGTVVFVVILFSHRSQRYEVVGVARAREYNVGLTCRARLISIPVQLFDKVRAGETVAIVNTSPDDERLEAEQAVIKAEMVYLELQLKELRKNYEAEIINRKSEWFAEMRAFTADVVTSTLRVEDMKTLLQNDREILGDLELEIKRLMTDRTQADDSAFYQLRRLKEGQITQTKKIEANVALLAKYQKELDEATARRDIFDQKYVPVAGVLAEEANNVIAKALEHKQREWDELEARRTNLKITAPFDGVVSRIDGREGEMVYLPDLPILTITEAKPTEVIAYASEEQAGRFREDMDVDIITRSFPAQIAKNARVTYIGPTVEQMPTRLWFDPTIPEWGRPIRIIIPPELDIIPGEVVGIRI